VDALIVVAHPEPRSFNAALADAAADTLRECGWRVQRSDLYAMCFDPVLGRGDFAAPQNPELLNVSLEQRHAVANGTLAADVAAELDKLLRADLLVLQFPLWWFGMPAVLKGWIDRVFVSGVTYSRRAMYERGKLRGKRAVVGVTTGAPAAAFGRGALHGDIADLLAPLHRGVLGFTGMAVLPPYVAHHVPYAGAAERAAMLDGWRRHLRGLDALTPLPMPRLEDHPELADDAFHRGAA
jgi:NAD(P)H dehydrogenase (quinone)